MKRQFKIAIGVAVTIILVAVILTVTLVLVLKSDSGSSSDSNPAQILEESLNQLSIYPSGSYQANRRNFTESTNPDHSFLPLDQNLLIQLIRIDNSSFVFEAGRQQYLYFLIPETFSNGKSIVDVSGIGIYFGQDGNSFNVVPMTDGSQATPGVYIIPTDLPNRARLISIQINPLSTMCSNVKLNDSCNEIQYSGYLIFDGMVRSKNVVTFRPHVACGDVCSSSGGNQGCSASCGTDCDGSTVAGADTPVSKRYNMRRKYSDFQFRYETYRIYDRIKVWNGEYLLFDTDCVGTQGELQIWLKLSNQVSLRVDVEPNCACQNPQGCTGTEWYFIVGCSDSCQSQQVNTDTSDLNRIKSSGRVILNDTRLNIDRDAQMPQLVASSCESVTWEVSFFYQAPFSGAIPFSYKVSGFSSATESFDVVRALENKTLGGTVTAKWTAEISKQVGVIIFFIFGSQPQSSYIMSYINASTNLWYAKKVASQESSGGTQFRNGLPLYSQALDNGYGIYQLTNPPPSYDQVWNWKANVDGGIKILENQQKAAQTWMKDQREQAKKETGADQPVSDERSGTYCLFSDTGNQRIEDAVAIKMFNGASGGNYCAWDNANRSWKFNRNNTRGENYVAMVCNQNQ